MRRLDGISLWHSNDSVKGGRRCWVRIRVSGAGEISREVRETISQISGSLDFICVSRGSAPGELEAVRGSGALGDSNFGFRRIVMEDVEPTASVTGAGVRNDQNAAVRGEGQPRIMKGDVRVWAAACFQSKIDFQTLGFSTGRRN